MRIAWERACTKQAIYGGELRFLKSGVMRLFIFSFAPALACGEAARARCNTVRKNYQATAGLISGSKTFTAETNRQRCCTNLQNKLILRKNKRLRPMAWILPFSPCDLKIR
jgi:hypothetical protein